MDADFFASGDAGSISMGGVAMLAAGENSRDGSFAAEYSTNETFRGGSSRGGGVDSISVAGGLSMDDSTSVAGGLLMDDSMSVTGGSTMGDSMSLSLDRPLSLG